MPDDLDSDEPSDESPVIRDLREKAKRADAAEQRTQQLERELVVHKAGLNGLTEKQMRALTAAHDGDWDPDSLKATAADLGFGNKTEQADDPQVPADELAAHRRVADAANGTPSPPPLTENATEDQKAAAIEAAKTPEELTAVLEQFGMLSTQ